jgi:uncharacterized integral membrane protein (TIGR00697 family)
MSISERAYRETEVPWAEAILISLYLGAQLLANIGSLKITRIIGFSIDAGTLIYPITFTIRDLIHKGLGKKSSQRVIWCSGGLNLLLAAYLALVSILPPDPAWDLPVGAAFSSNAAYRFILSPAWAIVLASIIAQLVSELVDTEVYQFFVDKVTRRLQWMRVIASNAVSIPIDSIIFCWVAFGPLGQNLGPALVWGIVLSNILIKLAVTACSLPAIYLVREREKR